MKTVTSVQTPEDARALGAHLLNRQRAVPVVVVATTQPEPWIDPHHIADQVRGHAEVFVLPTGQVTWALSDSLPSDAQVFGDAGRVYPPDQSWIRNPRTAKLYLCSGPERGPVVTANLIADALRAADVTQDRVGGPSPEAQELAQEVDDLAARLHRSQAEADRLRVALERSNLEKADLKKKLRAAKRSAELSAPDAVVFTDAEEQFRHEVYLAWTAQVPAGEKADRALPGVWMVGPEFLSSLEQLEGVSRSKVVEVVVQVLTGLDAQLAGRDLHRLRDGEAGNAPYVEREPGVHCWRVALQRGTPSARRLHYWRDGNIVELSRVVVHDDMTP